MLPVNTLNFCAFSMLPERVVVSGPATQLQLPHSGVHDSVLVAVPARDDNKIEIYRFPDEKLISVVPRVQNTETGEMSILHFSTCLLGLLMSILINTSVLFLGPAIGHNYVQPCPN